MKKIFIVLFAMVAIPFLGIAQTPKTAQTTPAAQTTQSEYPMFFIGLNGGLDYDINAHKIAPTTDGGLYFGEKPRYNIGADFGLQVSKRVRPRLELRYVNVKYGIDWSRFSPSSPGVIGLQKTIENVNYFDFNLRLDYLLFSIKKFQLFISPAFKYEFQTGQAGLNNYNVYDAPVLHHPSSIIAGGLSGIFKYNITNAWGITFTPEYTIFTHPFATGNSAAYQRYSANIGFEYRFGE